MKISYNWLKWYIPEVPEADKLADIFTYHLCEVESVEKLPPLSPKDSSPQAGERDVVFDINILPNRAHDLLSHQGVARELASLLNISFNDPTPKYKVPESKATSLEIKIESDRCRRYTARIVRNVKVGPSPDWVVDHLSAIGQRSINNMVDGANIVMYDCGQPIHVFDLDKVSGPLVVRMAKNGEKITTLDNKEVLLKETDLVIADEKNILAIAGVKGGKVAEVDENTKNIIIEIANFDPVSVRKTGRGAGIFTDALKRFENDLSPELCGFAMLEMSGLLAEYGCTDFEEVVDIYPKKQDKRKLSFRLSKISKMLGIDVSKNEMEDILKRYNFAYTNSGDVFEIDVPHMRLDLEIEEDMAEEVGRILGYDKVLPELPKIDFTATKNEEFEKIQRVRSYLLSLGFNEIITYSFHDKGKVEVLASASDKNFLRESLIGKNLAGGLESAVKSNGTLLPMLGLGSNKDLKVFEIGKVWNRDEEVHVAFFDGRNKSEPMQEFKLDDYVSKIPSDFSTEELPDAPEKKFEMWSMYPFIARDIALWVPEGVSSSDVQSFIKGSLNELVVRGPELFDEFKKPATPEGGGARVSYAFRIVFQSNERTLTDEEVNTVMQKVTEKLKENKDWEVR